VTGRDLSKEFVLQALRDAGLSGSDPHKEYAERRRDEGDEKYGIDTYKTKDCAKEGAEEAIDGANWLGFEFAKHMTALSPEDQRLLSLAAQHFALAYECVSRYIERRDT
jgi:hypothetical protein